MRHRNKVIKLSRPCDHRKALLKNLTISLIRYGSIETTLAKSKAIRSFTNRFIHNLLSTKEDFNAIRYIKREISSDCKTSITTVLKFYNQYRDQIKTNYIKTEKYYIRRSDAAKIVLVSLI